MYPNPNHAIVYPPIDRDKPSDEVADVFMRIVSENDKDIVVRLQAGLASGAFEPVVQPLRREWCDLDLDKVFVPWSNVLVHRDYKRCRSFTSQSGFGWIYPMQGCTHLAVVETRASNCCAVGDAVVGDRKMR